MAAHARFSPGPALGLAFGLAMLALAGCAADDDAGAPPRPAIVVQPQPAAAALQIFSGEVRAREEPALSFRVGGKIARRLVDAGSRVREGEVLAELDPRDLTLQADAVRAQLSAAEAELALARAERDRYAEMLERRLVSQSLFDAKQATFAAAQAQAESARAQLAVTQNQRDYAQLHAPAAGVIAARLAEAGQVVAAGQAVFTLAVDGAREVAISVPETQVGRAAVGTPVAVELWSRSGERWPGTVRELSPAADPQARTFAARVAFNAPASVPVDLGQSARVYLVEGDAARLSVPLSAVGGEAGEAFVWVLDPATARAIRRTVSVAAWGEREAVVSDGLFTSDWVVSGGVHLIAEGQRLQPIDRDNRPVKLTAAP